jgi:hypothetical protein
VDFHSFSGFGWLDTPPLSEVVMNRLGIQATVRALIIASFTVLSGCAPQPDPAPVASETEHIETPGASERQWFVNPLLPLDDTPNNRFGQSVALSGSTAVIGAPGVSTAYVFVLAEDGWHQQAKLEPPADFADRVFGSSVAISGDTILVGAPSFDLAGAAHVYARSGTSWSFSATLSADDPSAEQDEAGWGSLREFGASVALEGDTAAVGAPYASTGVEYTGQEGAAYVFTRSGSTWTQAKKLFAINGLSGDNFGYALAISGGTILVGSPRAAGSYEGRSYAFTRSGGDWDDGEELPVPDGLAYAEFGYSVALRADVAVVGAWSHRGRFAAELLGYRQGAAFVYTRTSSGWALQADWLVADDGEDLDSFGSAVAVSGNTAMAGAPSAGGELGDADTVYVFDPFTNPDIQSRIGNRGERPFFGGSLALEGDVAVVGTLFGRNGAYAAELRVVDGGACTSNLECRARHCVGGVCCDVACTGACESCATGTCTPLPQSSGTPSCAPYLCGEAGGGCPTSCTAHSHCVDTHHCVDGLCVPRLASGEACTEAHACESGRCADGTCAGTLRLGARCARALDCETGFCADGFCCDQRCEQQCEACDVTGAHGTCSPVTGAPHGQRPACAGADTVCGGQCDGEHSAACAYPTSATGCGTSCTDDMQTDSACNGQGACEAGHPYSCGSYACSNDSVACKKRCDSTHDCASGFTCLNEHCELGATCSGDWTAQSTDGTPQDCKPYRCERGSCRTTCDVPSDCAEGSVCDKAGHCVPAPSASSSSGESGGCSIAPPRTANERWTLWIFATLAAWFARLRALKARRKPQSSAS